MSSDELPRIPFIRPTFPTPDKLAGDFARISESNWYTNYGPVERAFSLALAEHIGPGTFVTTSSSGTTALIAAISVVFGRGDGSRYLVMPSFTFVAVAQSAVWAGYLPLFVDIDARTLQPSLPAAEAALESYGVRVAGVVLCNTFGVGNGLIEEWERFADRAGIPIVIDSAAGFGSYYFEGEHLGRRGACETFSFHATKPMAVGEGGAVASRDPEVVRRVEEFQNFGFSKGGRDSNGLGMNGKLAEFPSAIGLRQLESLSARVGQRRVALARMKAALEPLGAWFQPNSERSALCFASMMCPTTESKHAVMSEIASARVEGRDYYNPPVHRQAGGQVDAETVPAGGLPATEQVCERIVSLPLHDGMAESDVDRVIEAVRRGLR
jgi:dTDP-4-amino-4,6-dideoxygalactose transaminase